MQKQIGTIQRYNKNKFLNSILATDNLHQKINDLLNQIQESTGVTNEELEEFKKILDLSDFSEEN